MIGVAQLRAARALVGWSQDRLAAASGVSKPTIARLELGTGAVGGYAGTRDKLQAALEAAGVIFVDENGEGPGVRLRKERPTMHKEQKSAEELATMILAAMLPDANVRSLRVTPDKTYGWHVHVVAIPSRVSEYQARAETIAREFRAKYDLKAGGA